MPCKFDLHPDRVRVDEWMKEDRRTLELERWLLKRTGPNDRPITQHTLSTHRRICLGLGPLSTSHPARTTSPNDPLNVQPPPPHQRAEAPAAPVTPPGPRPSEQLGRPVTEDDIEQAMLKKFLDSIDNIPAEKVADFMIEREKARQRGVRAPAKGKEAPDGVEDPVAGLRRRIGEAVGARPTRTGVRMRAVRGGRAG